MTQRRYCEHVLVALPRSKCGKTTVTHLSQIVSCFLFALVPPVGFKSERSFSSQYLQCQEFCSLNRHPRVLTNEYSCCTDSLYIVFPVVQEWSDPWTSAGTRRLKLASWAYTVPVTRTSTQTHSTVDAKSEPWAKPRWWWTFRWKNQQIILRLGAPFTEAQNQCWYISL